MSYTDRFDPVSITFKQERCMRSTDADVRKALATPNKTMDDFLALLSPAAIPHLETMAQASHKLTVQRFGKTMQLFAPLYVSNLCYNSCTYCGFSMEHNYKRVILTDKEIVAEAKLLRSKGIQHVLLLTGEAERQVGLNYLLKAVELVKPYFSSIGIEVQPMEQDDYEQLIAAGVDNLTVYQETYQPAQYQIYHVRGRKKNFDYRLDTIDRGGKAGFYRMNIGALLGLYDWRYESIAIADHLRYLMKTYWQTKYGISFPRIKDMVGSFTINYEVTDQDIVQFICAFRLCFPDLAITLSTREPAPLRDQLFRLGITQMSAESNTAPGGYNGKEDSEKQFEISDSRTVEEVATMLQKNGYDPVSKDWVLDLGN